MQTQTGEIAIDTGLIDPNPNQPRQTITQESIQAKARLLKKHGQITPVILKEIKGIIQKISSGLSEITLANASREQLKSLQEILEQKLNEIGKLMR
ncbi:ParB N-terminal domain-containing protein [Nostoc favosum]|uniref:ParB N-terminal domain-containing protein n=1 Tax=Nostoc favosum CHAB5714 TaxID=2780399 RepID=A0ABS8IJS1_9NOSO|nr:ParB N-terminal domain-containing protein [Nostoc favosum]MCC5604114.1 ParB N-terminal domain-containing protein [Nostoc favosum CHAB5714]